MRYEDKKGFTMIEILVVIVILGILVGIATMNIKINLIKSRDAARKSDLSSIQKALELYQNDHGVYPAGDDGRITDDDGTPIAWGAVFQDSNDTIYMNELPLDPIINPGYCYQNKNNSVTNYQIYAKLENTKDKACLTANCATTKTCNSEPKYNFGVSSSNISP